MEKLNEEQCVATEKDCNEVAAAEEITEDVVAEVPEEVKEPEVVAEPEAEEAAEEAVEETVEETARVCENCGADLVEGQKFCAICGHKVSEVVTEEAEATNVETVSPAKKGNLKKVLIIGAIALVVLIALAIGVSSAQKSALKNGLMESKWWTYEDNTKLYLDFSDTEIDYSGDFGILGNCHIATLDYEVVDKDTILVHGKEVDVELEDGRVVFRPSFINSDSFSLWLD